MRADPQHEKYAGELPVTVEQQIPGNHRPHNLIPLSNQVVFTQQPFSYSFAANAFADDSGVPPTYTARLADGSALPSWMTFNAATRTFSGTPGAANTGVYDVQVIATDSGGLSTTVGFQVAAKTRVVINGTAAADGFSISDNGDYAIYGLGGDDIIVSGDGYDLLDGGAGNDVIDGLGGNDNVLGGDGSDNIDAGVGDDTIFGGTGNDYIRTGSGNDTVVFNRGDGADTVIGIPWGYDPSDVGTVETLRFGLGILPSDISIDTNWTPTGNKRGLRFNLRDSSGALTGDFVTIEDFFNTGFNGGVVNRVVFDSDPNTVWE